MTDKVRCPWSIKSQKERDYHDLEWGVPQFEDQVLLEFLILETMQAGLSWRTVLEKRENYRASFNNFNIIYMANLTDEAIEKLLENPGLIRNRAKMISIRANTQAFLKIQAEFGSFSTYFWDFIGGKPINNRVTEVSQILPKTPLSESLSKDMKKRGFSFFGPTTAYAFMQAIGAVNDHLITCFCHSKL